MADMNPLPISRKRKSVFEVAERRRQGEKERSKTKVILGDSFQRWRALKQTKGLKTDALVAKFLLDSYDNVTSAPQPETPWVRPPQPLVSTVVQESVSDRDADFFVLSSDSSSEEETSAPHKKARPSTSRNEPDEEEFNSLQNTMCVL
ncbi:hypothetical protein NL108_003850 [Boleophthalmus pectinirostris]|nr:hypothetical protein NL108_003850 [Boleophthalmus pectinirostris]